MPHLMNAWKHPKNGVLYFREFYPDEQTREAAGSKSGEYRRSLRTKDRREAAERYPAEKARWEAHLAVLRSGGVALTAKQAAAITGVWYRQLLSEAEAAPSAAAWWERLAALYRKVPAPPPKGLAAASLMISPEKFAPDPVALRAEAVVLLKGNEVSANEASILTVVRHMTARLEPLEAAAWKMVHGDFSPDPTLAKFPPWEPLAPPAGVSGLKSPLGYSALFTRWEKKAARAVGTVAEYRMIWAGFEKAVNRSMPAEVTTSDVEAWRDSLKASGKKTATVQKKYLAAVSAIYAASVGIGPDRLAANPVDGAWFTGRHFADSTSVRPYSRAELAAMLRTARTQSHSERRWVPWLIAYTGARSREIAQLRKSDVRKLDGVDYLDINEDHSDKKLKGRPGTKSPSVRDVPLHPHLIEEGFLDFVDGLPDGAHLFPRIKPRSNGAANEGRAMTQLREWLRGFAAPTPIGDTRILKPQHSLRHGFEDLLRGVTEDVELRRDLQGREDGTSARGYGLGHALKQKAAVIRRIPRLC